MNEYCEEYVEKLEAVAKEMASTLEDIYIYPFSHYVGVKRCAMCEDIKPQASSMIDKYCKLKSDYSNE